MVFPATGHSPPKQMHNEIHGTLRTRHKVSPLAQDFAYYFLVVILVNLMMELNCGQSSNCGDDLVLLRSFYGIRSF